MNTLFIETIPGKLYLFYEDVVGDGSEDSADANILSPQNLEYLENMGNTSMHELIAMKGTTKSIMNSFNNGHAPLNEDSNSLENLKMDASFNTSSSGWKFNKGTSNNNSKIDVGAQNQNKRVQLQDDVLFNPDIVAIGLEFCKCFFLFAFGGLFMLP